MSKTLTNEIRAVVLLSGGVDSAVALYWAMEKGYKVQSLGFNYFLRSRKENEAAKNIARLNGIGHLEINLRFLREIEDSTIKRNPMLKNAERAYIPSRNVIFYGIASSIAELADARYIVGGHNKDDVDTFPDSSLQFFRHFNAATRIGLISGDRTGRVILPLAKLSKTEVIKLGKRLDVPFELTWSCYRSSKYPCRKCHSCILRKRSFDEAKIKDPLTSS